MNGVMFSQHRSTLDLPIYRTTSTPVQVDRYKQLLLKQRDIMIALTARLNERDDQISMLQVRSRSSDKDHSVQGIHVAWVL